MSGFSRTRVITVMLDETSLAKFHIGTGESCAGLIFAVCLHMKFTDLCHFLMYWFYRSLLFVDIAVL